MCDKSADSPFGRIVGRLRSAGNILILSHARPDGDSLGSMLALARWAEGEGKTVRLLSPDPVPARYGFLFAGRQVAPVEHFSLLADAADVIVVMDTCTFNQLDGLADELRPRREKIVAVDHHQTIENVGAVQWIDPSAAAAGVMTAELLDALGGSLDLPTAEALMTAITTDTGWLHFANTDGRCLRLAARLLDLGVRPDQLYRQIFQTDRPERLALTARMLQSLELHAGGRLAVMTLRKADFQATGALPEETENLINEALRIGSVETAVILVENADFVRISLRSRQAVNVAEVARRFGGGGHPRAAGARVAENIDALKSKLIDACAAALEKASPSP